MSYFLLFLLMCSPDIVVPVRPNATHNVNSTAIQVDIDVPVSGFNVSRYCVTFTWLAVSNVPLNASITTTLCGLTSTITLSPVQEDATYEYYATVNNTDGSHSKPSTSTTVRTLATGELVIATIHVALKLSSLFGPGNAKMCLTVIFLDFIFSWKYGY